MSALCLFSCQEVRVTCFPVVHLVCPCHSSGWPNCISPTAHQLHLITFKCVTCCCTSLLYQTYLSNQLVAHPCISVICGHILSRRTLNKLNGMASIATLTHGGHHQEPSKNTCRALVGNAFPGDSEHFEKFAFMESVANFD